MKETKPWFEVWFDTNEYHVLYGHRDEKEARTQPIDQRAAAGRQVRVLPQLGLVSVSAGSFRRRLHLRAGELRGPGAGG